MNEAWGEYTSANMEEEHAHCFLYPYLFRVRSLRVNFSFSSNTLITFAHNHTWKLLRTTIISMAGHKASLEVWEVRALFKVTAVMYIRGYAVFPFS